MTEEQKSNIENIKEETKIPFLDDVRSHRINNETIYDSSFKYFKIKPKDKEDIMVAIAMARAEGIGIKRGGLILLVPAKRFRSRPKNFTYPIEMFGAKVYIVPYIREIMWFELE